jgi:hypothetical protein
MIQQEVQWTYTIKLGGVVIYTTNSQTEFDNYCKQIYDTIKFENVVTEYFPDSKCAQI